MLQLIIFIGISLVLCICDITIEYAFDDIEYKAWKQIGKEYFEQKTLSSNCSIVRYEDTLEHQGEFLILCIILITGLGIILQTNSLIFINLQNNLIIYNLFLMCFAGMILCFILSVTTKISHLVNIYIS